MSKPHSLKTEEIFLFSLRPYKKNCWNLVILLLILNGNSFRNCSYSYCYMNYLHFLKRVDSLRTQLTEICVFD